MIFTEPTSRSSNLNHWRLTSMKHFFLFLLLVMSTISFFHTVGDAQPQPNEKVNKTLLDNGCSESFEDYLHSRPLRVEVLLQQSNIALTPQRRPNPGGQVGTYCVARPNCPDCASGGNVCRGAEQFYPGLTYFLGGKKDIIRRCQQANALDYCGGSMGCVKQKNWTPRDGERHRARYGGGCYKQCEKVAACAFQGRP